MKPTRPKLFIAIPCYRQFDSGFAQCLLKLQVHLATTPYDWCMDMLVGDSLVSRARNTLTARFLKSDCTHLLFLDSDLIFSGDQIDRLVAHNRDIIAGLYCKKAEGNVALVMNRHGHQSEIAVDDEGIADVAYVGTGFMLVRREVFEQMQLAYPYNDYKADESNLDEHDFWQVGVHRYADGTKRYLSEDWFFCQKCLDIGFKVYADTHIVAKHVGHAVYPLKTQEAGLFGSSQVIGHPSTAPTNGSEALPPADIFIDKPSDTEIGEACEFLREELAAK